VTESATAPATKLGFWNIVETEPDRIAVIDVEHVEHSWAETAAEAHRIVHGLRALGVGTGDTIATLLPNSFETVALMLATGEAGIYLTPVNYHLTGPEVAYIVDDSESKVFIAHERFADAAVAVSDSVQRFAVGSIDGFAPYSDLLKGQPETLPDDRTSGTIMNYTSGTTGRPKGVKRPLTGLNPNDAGELGSFLLNLFGIPPMGNGRHLVAAPLYHTAVGQYMMASLNGGHAAVLMDQWSPEGTLERIERHRVTESHMVPTMFNRMLKMPDADKQKYDVSSMTHAIHSAAPCPIPTKQAMLDWWGPCIYEYYAATEGGGTLATPEDWLKKPGTVGKPWPISEVVVFDDDGNKLSPGEVGTVWMRMGDQKFEYHKDKEKTEKSWKDGYFTVGDAGYLDEDGYLFLADRKIDMIISGGVNIYPAEVESVLIQHADIADCAVFGIPHDDWGEEVKAAVQLADGVTAGPEQEEKLLTYLKENVAKYKLPRSIDFHTDFPRDPNGKLYKRKLRDPYWEGRTTQI
jgi:long-chain acyl-CoA synthetase